MRERRATAVLPDVAGAMRMRHWAHFLLLPFASLCGGEPTTLAVSLPRGVAIAFSVLAFGYLLNGVSDRAMDRSVEKNALAGQLRPGVHVHAVLFALSATAVGLSLSAPWPVTLATAICLASGVVYSVGPRLKQYPVVGTLLNVTNFAPLLWVGLSAEEIPAGLGPLTLAFVGLLLQNQLIHEAADRDEDARGRVVTTVRAFGERASAIFAAGLGLVVASAPDGLVLSSLLGLVFVAGFPLALALRGRDARLMNRVRRLHRLASVAAGAAAFVAVSP